VKLYEIYEKVVIQSDWANLKSDTKEVIEAVKGEA